MKRIDADARVAELKRLGEPVSATTDRGHQRAHRVSGAGVRRCRLTLRIAAASRAARFLPSRNTVMPTIGLCFGAANGAMAIATPLRNFRRNTGLVHLV